MIQREIQFIWNESNREPYDIDIPILAQTENNKLIVFKNTKCFINRQSVSNWDKLVAKYKIKYWCYQSAITEYDRLDYEDYWDD